MAIGVLKNKKIKREGRSSELPFHKISRYVLLFYGANINS